MKQMIQTKLGDNGELVKLVQGCTVATTRNTDVIEKLGEGVDRLTVVLNKGG